MCQQSDIRLMRGQSGTRCGSICNRTAAHLNKNLAEGPAGQKDPTSPASSSSDMYDMCTFVRDRSWWSVSDVAGRALRALLLFAYLAVCYPISFFKFTLQYNIVWYNRPFGTFLTLFYPIMPVAIFFVELGKRLLKYLSPVKSFDDGSVFFVSPPTLVASLIWEFLKTFQMYVGAFLQCGADVTAIEHTWYDRLTHKHFWRKILEESGAEIPRCVGTWDGTALSRQVDSLKLDVVIKLPDSYLGIGDKYMVYGEDFTEEAEIEAVLQAEYQGKEAFLLDFVRPKKGMEVHQFDILTIKTVDGVQPLSVIYWGDCSDGKSSHSTRAGYVCDYRTERIISAAKWYSAAFSEMATPRLNESLPGLRDAVDRACAAHEAIELPWLKVCGWDCMLTDQRGPVFFEGNYACARLPRRLVLDWKNLTTIPRALLATGI